MAGANSNSNEIYQQLLALNDSAKFMQLEMSPADRSQYLTTLEMHLISGQRDAALSLALTKQDWAMAMMLASMAGPEKYQEVVRLYSMHTFSSANPMYLLSMIFTNQAAKPLLSSGARNIPKFITNTASTAAANSNTTTAAVADDTVLIKNWKLSLSSILSNKTSDWTVLTQILGYRLQSDYQVSFLPLLLLVDNYTTNPRFPFVII
jgi:hypothetical protein